MDNMGPSQAEYARDGGDSAAVDPLTLFNVVLRRRGTVLLIAFAVVLIGLFIALSRPVLYTAVVAFMPEGQRPNSGVSSLAAQFGVNVNTTDGLSSPQFYPELIRSPQFLGAVVDSLYPLDSAAGQRRNLTDIYGIPGTDQRVRRENAVVKLAQNVNPVAAPRTGIITVQVTTPDPVLSRDISARILQEVTRFNQHTRQGRAAAERRFVETRLSAIKDSLRDAEDRLQRFLMENRDYRTSPILAFRFARLQREVDRHQLILGTLAPSFEQAKIEEVRDTPVLTVLRRPEAPVWPNPRGRVRLMAIALLGGLALGVAVALGIEGWRRRRAGTDPAAVEFTTLTADIGARVRQRQFVSALFGSRKPPAELRNH